VTKALKYQVQIASPANAGLAEGDFKSYFLRAALRAPVLAVAFRLRVAAVFFGDAGPLQVLAHVDQSSERVHTFVFGDREAPQVTRLWIDRQSLQECQSSALEVAFSERQSPLDGTLLGQRGRVRCGSDAGDAQGEKQTMGDDLRSRRQDGRGQGIRLRTRTSVPRATRAVLKPHWCPFMGADCY